MLVREGWRREDNLLAVSRIDVDTQAKAVGKYRFIKPPTVVKSGYQEGYPWAPSYKVANDSNQSQVLDSIARLQLPISYVHSCD